MFTFSAPISSEGGHPSFQNNVPDPVTSGAELPVFKFELEKSTGRVIEGSYGKEATVEQLPIYKGLAGVSMLMQPGVMRELHWHATAAEWASPLHSATISRPLGRVCFRNSILPSPKWNNYGPASHSGPQNDHETCVGVA